MSIANYSSLFRRIDRQPISSLEPFLAIPLKPMVLWDMNHFKDPGEFFTQSVEQLVARTARCYEAFSYPAMSSSLRLHNAERLKWAQRTSLREFKQCLALRELVKEYVSTGQHLKADCFASRKDGAPSPSDGVAREAPDSLPGILDRVDDRLDGADEPPFLSPSYDFDGDDTLAAFEEHSAPFPKLLAASPLSAPHALDPAALSFELALELLRPKGSILDVVFNEASIRSARLNDWFYYYCRHRVAWRVLHEHLLHLARPGRHPRVVHDAVGLPELLRTVAAVVAGLARGVVVRVEDDPGLLARPPAPGLRAVRDHLFYVLRELLKNACAATLRARAADAIVVRFAVGPRHGVVEVADRAGGIPPGLTAHIWRFGWTTHRYRAGGLGGLGVGLPISKVFMDMWDGAIDVYSVWGEGTTVRVRFPKAPTEVLASNATLRPD